jgi:hypothetical protein
MITRIPDMPPGTLGFAASGRVRREDYEDVMVPAVEAASAAGPLRLLYVLGSDFESYSPGAMWSDTRLWAGHLGAWERVAVATDVDWVEHAVHAFGWLVHGHIRRFGEDEVDDAIRWLTADQG